MVADEIKRHFKEAVFQVIVPRNVKLAEAPSYGKPVILYDIKSRGAESYFELAKEILMRDVVAADEENMKQQLNEGVSTTTNASDNKPEGL